MIKLGNLELVIPPNGLRISKTVLSDNKNWYTRQLLVNTKEDSKQMGFELVAITGKRHYKSYAKEAEVDPTKASSTYANILQTNISLNGINLDISNVGNIYTAYKTNQEEWALKDIYLQRIQDPDLTITDLDATNDALKNHSFTTISLNIFTEHFDVFFTKGQSCNFNYLVHSSSLFTQYTDFSFNLLAWEPIV